MRQALKMQPKRDNNGNNQHQPQQQQQQQSEEALNDEALQAALQIERQCLYYGTRDGAVGVVVPVAESLFRRLRTLQERMQSGVAWPCGLSPAAFRVVSQPHHQGQPPSDRAHLLDADALLAFASLDDAAQKDLARRSATTSRQIINNLLEINLTTELS